MARVVVPGFLPSEHGFRFANAFTPQPLFRIPLPLLGGLGIGNAARGLCGGMIFSAWDYYLAQLSPPADAKPPTRESALFPYLVRRLFDSFHLPWGPLRYYRWMASRALVRHTIRWEWPLVRDEIAAGRLAALGLIRLHCWNPLRLGENHQVLAYAHEINEETGNLTLWVYDPNHPGRDDVTLTLNLHEEAASEGIVASTGETVRGFFWTPFRHPRGPLPSPGGSSRLSGEDEAGQSWQPLIDTTGESRVQ